MQRGIGLLEVIVWIAVFVAAMFALMSSVLYFYRTSNYAISQSGSVASGQRGIDSVVKTIRAAAYASNGAYPIVSIATSSVVLYANIDSDPGIERVRFYLATTTLYRGVTEPQGDPATYAEAEAASTVSEYVRNLDATVGTTTFTYYDKNGAQVTDYAKIGDVRFVTLTLVVDVDPNRSPTILTLRSSTALRNLIGK